jgi:hypothetical protein
MPHKAVTVLGFVRQEISRPEVIEILKAPNEKDADMPAPDFSPDTIMATGSRAGFICSQPQCRTITIGPVPAAWDTRLKTKIGEGAHIRSARKSRGDIRFDPLMTDDERAYPSNCIWLCSSCHGIVDKNGGAGYPVALLKKWKSEHEELILSLLLSPRSPMPLIRSFAEETQAAQELIEEFEQAGALFRQMRYEVGPHVMLSIKELRKSTNATRKKINYDTDLKRAVTSLATSLNATMNFTNNFDDRQQAELLVLRHRVYDFLHTVEAEFGCKVTGHLKSALQERN